MRQLLHACAQRGDQRQLEQESEFEIAVSTAEFYLLSFEQTDGENCQNHNNLQPDDEGHKEEQEPKWDRGVLLHELRVCRKELGRSGMKISQL